MKRKNHDLIGVKIKNSKISTTLEVIGFLYELVDSGTIKNYEIKKINKGKHSVESDISFWLSIGNSTYPFLKDLVRICKRKWSDDKFVSYQMKVNDGESAGFGYGYRPIDTVVCPARPDTMEKVFHKRHQWGEVAVAQNKFGLLENLAMYETSVRAIRYYAEIDEIIPSQTRKGFVTIFLKNKPKLLQRPIHIQIDILLTMFVVCFTLQ